MTVDVRPGALETLARAYLDRQPWFQLISAGASPDEITLTSAEHLSDEPAALVRLTLACRGRNFQLFAGWRQATEVAGLLGGREGAIFGSANGDGKLVLVYDALADDALAVEILRRASDDKATGRRVRQLATLASHASLVYDERVLMKCYRVFERGLRPEIELLERLDAVGFNAMPSPIAFWQSDGADLALVREFLPSALEGRLLALTSLRDLLARASAYDPRAYGMAAEVEPDAVAATAGGDLASELRRLGQMAAHLHLALAEAFVTSPLRPADLAQAASEGSGGSLDPDVVEALGRLQASEAGVAIRLHGDFHLRRVMRSETGWVLAGFGDDPLYADPGDVTSIPARRGSAAEDVADLCFSIGRVAAEALAQRPSEEAELAARLAGAWERRACRAVLEGYSSTAGIGELVPLAALEPFVAALCRVRQRRYEATLASV